MKDFGCNKEWKLCAKRTLLIFMAYTLKIFMYCRKEKEYKYDCSDDSEKHVLKKILRKLQYKKMGGGGGVGSNYIVYVG